MTSRDRGGRRAGGLAAYSEANQFPKGLFPEGVYVFDRDKFNKKAGEDLKRWEQAFSRRPADDDWSRRRRAEDMQRLEYEMIWKQRFSGKIPKHWVEPKAGAGWANIAHDIKNAKERGQTIPDTLIDAAVSHPSWIVVKDVSEIIPLTTHQLAWILVRPYQPGYSIEPILDAQRGFGMTDKQINEAKAHAKLVKENIEKKQKGAHTLPDSEISRGTLSDPAQS